MAEDHDRDGALFSRPRHVPGVEVVSASYRDRRFPQHSHPEYVVGAVTAGSESLVVKGQSHVVGRGDVLHLNPDQTHANATLGQETLRYSVIYVPPASVTAYAEAADALAFSRPVTTGSAAFRTVIAAHVALMNSDSEALEQESAVQALVQALCLKAEPAKRHAASPRPIAAARDYIDEHFARGFGLTTLSEVTGLSIFHLVRSFKATVGLSPLAYRNQRRIAKARELLLAGQPIAQTALAVGFADQSHFTRQFQRLVGTSPGRYLQQ